MSKGTREALEPVQRRVWLVLDPEDRSRLEELARAQLRSPRNQAALLLKEVLREQGKAAAGAA